MSSQLEQRFVVSREHKIANRGLDGEWVLHSGDVIPHRSQDSGLAVLFIDLVDADDPGRLICVPTHWVKRAGS